MPKEFIGIYGERKSKPDYLEKSYTFYTHTQKNIFPRFRKQTPQLTVPAKPKGTQALYTNGNANWSKGASHLSELAIQYQFEEKVLS